MMTIKIKKKGDKGKKMMKKKEDKRDEEEGWGVGGGERIMVLVLSPHAKGI